MRNHTQKIGIVLAAIALGGAVYFLRSGNGSPPEPPVVDQNEAEKKRKREGLFLKQPPAPETEEQVGGLGTLRISQDQDAKRGEFWLEQAIEFPPLLPQGALADLYLTLDPQTAAGWRLHLTRTKLKLEKLTPGAEGKPAPEVLAEEDVERLLEKLNARERPHLLAALWRGGELTAWLDEHLVFAWKGEADLSGCSGGASRAGVRLGARRALALERVLFRDTFMRDSAGHNWQPLRGKWELTALAFPERSANPFSLRASFDGDPPAKDKLYEDRLRRENFGIGVQLGSTEGTLHIVRITGGSPAARAGLAEDDTIVEVQGMPVEEIGEMRAQYMLQSAGGFDGKLTIKVLRPGEKSLRSFTLTRDHFVWGTPLEGTLLKPVGADDEALVLGGEDGWSDYAAEAAIKPLGNGGAGLAIAATSAKDYLLLRWLGPPQSAQATGDEMLQLVRVAGGAEQVVAERAVQYRPYEFYRLALDWRGEDVLAYVDGVEVFREKVPGLRRGKVGLYAQRGEPVFFDDVTVASDRSVLENSGQPQRRLNEIFATEQDMERWANPALEWKRDPVTGWAVHTSRFPGEQLLVLKNPKFQKLEIRLFCDARGMPADDPAQKPVAGFGLVFSGNVLTFYQNGQPLLGGKGFLVGKQARPSFERIAIRAKVFEGLELEVDGERISLPVQKSHGPPAGFESIAIRGLENLGDPKTVYATSSGVREYSFDAAPTDWKVASGRWGLLNKWICDPRWSWFGGRSETVAAIWNKQVFGGDVTVEAHIALMMQNDSPPYERAGDYNLVLCGDGTHLDSGYSLVFGGGRNYWTRLYRNGKLVAESTAPEVLVPSDRVQQLDKPELHQRWFHLKLEKIGNKVSFFRDGVRAFTFSDPEPLGEGRVGFWTMDNGVLLSRCRIAFERVKPGPLESRGSALYNDGQVINMYDGEVHTRVELEALPPAIAAALMAPPASFKPVSAEAVPGKAAGDAAKGWRTINAGGGGPMALHFHSHGQRFLIDPVRMGIVRFAIRLDPGAAVDFCLKDHYRNDVYRWRISGPETSDESLPCLDRIEVPADGRWHAVQFDLFRGWQRFWKSRGYVRAPGGSVWPFFGCPAHHAYAVAGFGVNRAGASYSVSPLSFLSAEDIDREPPALKKVVWPFDADGDGRHIGLVFDDPGGSGLDLDTLHMTLNGGAVGTGQVEFDADAQTATVDLQGYRRGQPIPEGMLFSLKLAGFSDRAGNSSEGSLHTWTFTVAQAAQANKPAGLPAIQVLTDDMERQRPPQGPLDPDDVYATAGNADAILQFTGEAPPWAAEPRSARVASLRDGSAFGIRAPRYLWELARWPYLAIEYKIPFEVAANLHFQEENGAKHVLVLTDLGEADDAQRRRRPNRPWAQFLEDHTGVFVGPPEGFVADNTWRRAEIPLLKLLAAEAGRTDFAPMTRLELRDGGYRGNRRGMEYFVHAIHALPAGRAAGLAFNWTAPGLVAASDYTSAIDEKPDTVPEPGTQTIRPSESVLGAAKRATSEGGDPLAHPIARDGWKYLHVRIRNAAGVWSDTAHYKFRVDNTPPKVAATQPPDGGRLAGKTIRIRLAEDHAVKRGSLRLAINGNLFTGHDAGLSFDPATQTLSYDDTQSDRPVHWPEGSTVRVELQGAEDCLGNALFAHHAFTFTAARSADREGPRIEQVRFSGPDQGLGESIARPVQLELSMALNFEETLGHVRALQDCELEWTQDARTAGFGERSVRFVAQETNGDMRIMLHKNAWYLDRYPQIHFDYKASLGVNVDVQALILGEWYTVGFLGDGQPGPEGEKVIGKLDGIVADGTWRHATVDLRRLVDRAAGDLPVRIVSQIRLAGRGRPGLQRGAELWLDNLHMMPDSAVGGKWEWTASDDPSGLAGFSVVVDRRPETEAPLAILTRDDYLPETGRTGTWYLHVRAQDQAGNWGPTRHYRVDF